MKTLTEKIKSKINSYIDHELNSKDEYKVKQILQTNEEAAKFYHQMSKVKHVLNYKSNVKASENFTEKLFSQIENLSSKKDRLSLLKKFMDSITIQKLSYAGASLLFFAFFGFALLNIAKSGVSVSQEPTAIRSEQGVTQPGAPAASEAPVAATSPSSANTPQPKAVFKYTERTQQADEEAAAESEANQRITRRLFDNLERQGGNSNNATAQVQFNLNQGVEHFYKRNFVASQRHFRQVLQSASKNSVQYLQAQDYLKRIPQR